jgi:hypothetical protein
LVVWAAKLGGTFKILKTLHRFVTAFNATLASLSWIIKTVGSKMLDLAVQLFSNGFGIGGVFGTLSSVLSG